MPQKERPEGVDRSPVSISEPVPHTQQHSTTASPTAAAAAANAQAPAYGSGLTEDQLALVSYLRKYGFVGAVGFVRKMPNWAIWDALVEVDSMGLERRADFRSLGALIRYLVREACSE
jgi:hypothetical protein